MVQMSLCQKKDGMRPYSIALEKGDIEMAEYFKSLEPVEYHSLQNKLDELKTFKLPKNVIDFLQGDKLHFELNDCDFKWIEFFSLIDTITFLGNLNVFNSSNLFCNYDIQLALMI